MTNMKLRSSCTVVTSSVRPVLPHGLTESRLVLFVGQRLWMTRHGETVQQRILRSFIDLSVLRNPGELYCNASNVNMLTDSHWEFVSKKK